MLKKILLIISKYFSIFSSVLLISLLFLLYVMHTVPAVFWIGNMEGRSYRDNFGSGLINFFDLSYINFFLMPFLPILGALLLLSVFVWIFYRKDEKAGKIGFRNTVLCILLVFVIFYLPMKASLMEHDIRYLRQKQIDELFNDDIVKVNPRLEKEVQKIYQSLYYEGVLEWRSDPVAVVDYELEKGDLKHLGAGHNKLTLVTTSSDEDSGFSQATVLLENKKINAEINLMSYWSSDGQVWTVRRYTKLEQNEYNNKDLGVKFSYLEDFYIEESDSANSVSLAPIEFRDQNQIPDARIYSSLRFKKISREEYEILLNDFQEKAVDKEVYPDYSQHDILVDEKPAVLIEANDPFYGGMVNHVFINNQDNILFVSYFADTSFNDVYKNILDNIVLY